MTAGDGEIRPADIEFVRELVRSPVGTDAQRARLVDLSRRLLHAWEAWRNWREFLEFNPDIRERWETHAARVAVRPYTIRSAEEQRRAKEEGER